MFKKRLCLFLTLLGLLATPQETKSIDLLRSTCFALGIYYVTTGVVHKISKPYVKSFLECQDDVTSYELIVTIKKGRDKDVKNIIDKKVFLNKDPYILIQEVLNFIKNYKNNTHTVLIRSVITTYKNEIYKLRDLIDRTNRVKTIEKELERRLLVRKKDNKTQSSRNIGLGIVFCLLPFFLIIY